MTVNETKVNKEGGKCPNLTEQTCCTPDDFKKINMY